MNERANVKPNRSLRAWAIAAGALALSFGVLLSRPDASAQPAKTAPAKAVEDGPLTEQKVVERVTAATDKGLEYLRSKQRPDGGWANNQAVNSFALLAYMGRGHTPGRGRYRDVLQRGKRYLLAGSNAQTGFISFSSMYEHGMATLALAEMYGMDHDPELDDKEQEAEKQDLEQKLRKAVDLIVASQSASGGWRYAPSPQAGQDLSVTVMQVVALRAANNAEIPVPAGVIDKAVKYVQGCASPAGGYGYEGPGQGAQTSAAGVLCLQLMGKYADPGIPPAMTYLATVPVQWGGGNPNYFYYFHYYAMQAHYQYGGQQWNDWHPRVRELLLEKQNADGSWDVPPGTAENEGVVGPNKVYWTALACLVLDIYLHYLPAYQR